MVLANDLDHADDVLALAGMVEERAVALLHLHQVLLGGVIAHARPFRALGAGLDLLVPRPAAGLALHQPVSHECFSSPIVPNGAAAPAATRSPDRRSFVP